MPENPKQNSVTNLKEKISKLSSERKWAMSCYIPVFNIVVCILASIRMISDKFVSHHARQGLVLFAMWFVTIVVSLISPTLSLMLLGVVLLLHIVGVIAAYKSKTSEITVVTGFANKIPEDYIFKKLTGKTPEKTPDANPAQENVQTPPATPETPPAAPDSTPPATPETPPAASDSTNKEADNSKQ